MKEKNISEEELAKLKKEIRECLAIDRHSLLVQFPFVGNLLMRMNLIPVRDVRCLTACTDGNNVFFNIAFYQSLKKEECLFVLAHEIFHCVLLHLTRRQCRNHDLFNIATDMEVNYMLEQQNLSIFKAPKDLLFPPKSMQGKSAEVIYEWLLRKQKKQKNQQAKSGTGAGGNSSSDSQPDKSNKKSKNNGNSNGQGQSDDDFDIDSELNGKKDGKKTGKLSGQFDSHKYNDDDDQDSNADSKKSDNSKNGAGTGIFDKYGEVGFDKDFKPSISDDFSEKMREAVIAEIHRAQRTQGHTPAGLEGVLEQLLKPELNWKELLANFITRCYNGSRRWLPPNRRHLYHEMYFQSRRSEKLNVTVCIDTSGSCIGDLPKFFGELKGLLDSFGAYELTLLNCDADVSYCEKFDSSNPLELDKVSNIKWSGGGGTSFCPPFKYVREHNIVSDCFLYLTDGYGDAPLNPPPYPVLWVLTKDGNENFCNWGTKIKFRHSSYDGYTQLSS